MSVKPKSVSDTYKKKTLREHVLLRPAMYVGSDLGREEYMWIVNDSGRMEIRPVNFIPALHKIFDEVLVNALDHHARKQAELEKGKPKSAAKDPKPEPVKNIWVTIDENTISVKNDGDGISVTVHETEKVYIPELIFTELLTGQNYEEDEEKTVGGQNGMGAKLANIFSTEFTVETVDGVTGRKFTQTCRKNMTEKDKPRVVASKNKPYTMITFTPDMSRFTGMDGEKYETIPEDMIATLKTRVYQAAMCAGPEVKVYLNGEHIDCKTMPLYMELFTDAVSRPVDDSFDFDEDVEDDETEDTADDDAGSVETTTTTTTTTKKRRGLSATAAAELGIFYERSGPRWEYGVLLGSVDVSVDETKYPDAKSKSSAVSELRRRLHQQSFANGINTHAGGTHVEHVRDQFIKKVREYIVKRKKVDIEPAQLKEMFVVFVNATIINPVFTPGQTKDRLDTPARDTKTTKGFGSLAEVSDKFVDKVMKSGLEQKILDYIEGLEAIKEAKSNGRSRGRVIIDKYDGALRAGTAESEKCTLILTEGDSAKSLALAGLHVIGRDYYGVFPLKGKVMNVKETGTGKKAASGTRGNANVEIQNLKKILGLVSGMEYTAENLKMLRYGRIMIMTDQDVDGSHIKGLIINLFHTKWKSLLQLGYLTCMVTPVIKVYRGSEAKPTEVIPFYSIPDYEAWCEANDTHGWKTKYYKGLATSTSGEAREYFSSLAPIHFTWDSASDKLIALAFSKGKDSADARKRWLNTYDKDATVDFGVPEMPIPTFVNNELIHFSVYSNLRSIPHSLDGLKPSQRKILWACFRRGLTTTSIKVAQLGGYVSEHAAYHHGEKSLEDAIKGMAQNFIHSNNVNLLHPQGQFGSRLMGGKDAGSARYIFTRLSDITSKLFRTEDFPVLKYMEDDGRLIEPEYYVPVLPMILINGASGIGTGYSSDIPRYNPRDLLAAARLRIAVRRGDVDGDALAEEEPLVPWTDGFKGTIEQLDEKRYASHGCWEITGPTTIRVTELPLGTWCEGYQKMLTKWYSEDDKRKEILKTKEGGKNVYYKLKQFDVDCTDVRVEFRLTLEAEFVTYAHEDPEWAEAALRLVTADDSIKTSNMVAFDGDMHLQRFDNVGEIIDAHTEARLDLYAARREYQIQQLEAGIPERRAKKEFIAGVMNGKIDLRGKDDVVIARILKTAKFPALGKGSKTVEGEDGEVAVETHNPDTIEAYAYLLNLKQSAVSKKGFAALEKELADMEKALEIIKGKTPEDMWSEELDEFETAYEKFLVEKNELLTANIVEKAGPKKRGSAAKKSAAKAATPKKTVKKSAAKPKK